MTAPGRGERGQASVELALLLPPVALVLLLVVQVAVIARDQVLVQHAAREAARGAAVGTDPDGGARRAAMAAGGLDRSRLDVRTAVVDGRAVVSVTYREPTEIPLVGRALPDLDLRASATMQREEP